jgi:hypothetical protein
MVPDPPAQDLASPRRAGAAHGVTMSRCDHLYVTSPPSRSRAARPRRPSMSDMEGLALGAVANGFPNDVWTALWAPSVQSCLEAKDLLTLLRRIPVLVASGWEGTPKPRRSHR